jgi:hypothetical protein
LIYRKNRDFLASVGLHFLPYCCYLAFSEDQASHIWTLSAVIWLSNAFDCGYDCLGVPEKQPHDPVISGCSVVLGRDVFPRQYHLATRPAPFI